jgi:SAM-dependent methyltransferase
MDDPVRADGNLTRFSGFAEIYDHSRPSPPEALGPLLASYAAEQEPVVVDLGSGTGLSSRWAAGWSRSVTGIEPNDDMRFMAESHDTPAVTYLPGLAHATGLVDGVADVVVAVQAMHWMDPEPTLAEVARILRPGGVFAAVDADWPPTSGVVGAERAWIRLQQRIRVFEARASRGLTAAEVRYPIGDDDPAPVDDDSWDVHRNRAMPGGVKSWPKSQHLRRLVSCGHFEFVREVVLSDPSEGRAERFVALMRSQGSYQGLCRLGISDEDLGVDVFENEVTVAFAAARWCPGLSFSWRVRLGVTPAHTFPAS